MASHRCLARALFSELGESSFQLDALVEACDDPMVTAGLPFTLQLHRPNRRSVYLLSKVRASVELGHSLFVDGEDYLTARKARLCANGWTVVLDVSHATGWPRSASPRPTRHSGHRPPVPQDPQLGNHLGSTRRDCPDANALRGHRQVENSKYRPLYGR